MRKLRKRTNALGQTGVGGKQNKFVRSQYSSYLIAVVLDLGSRHKHSCLKEISRVTSVPPCSGSSPLGTLGID